MKNDRRTVAVLFVVYAIQACFVFNRADRLVHDDGFVTTLAHLINRGYLPYRDFFLALTPGTFFLQALLQRLFGDELIVGRIFVLLQHLALFWVIWRISVLANLSPVGRVLPVALLFFGPLFSHPFYSLDALLLASLMLWSSGRYVATGSVRQLLIAAALAAATVLFKQNVGLASVVFVSGVAVWKSRTDWQNQYLYYGAAVLGVVAPFVLFAGYLVSSQSVGAFVDNVILAPSSIKVPLIPAQVAAFVLPNRFGLPLIIGVISMIAGWRLSSRLRAICWSVPILAFGLAAAEAYRRDHEISRLFRWLLAGMFNSAMLVPISICVVGGWLLWTRRLSSEGGSPWLALLLWFSTLHFVAAAIAGATWYHLSMAFPFVYLLAGGLLTEIGHAVERPGSLGGLRSALPIAFALLIAFGATINLYVSAFGERMDSSWRRNPVSALANMVDAARPGLRGMRLSSDYVVELEAVIDYVQAQTAPRDEIFAFPMGMPLYPAVQRFSTSYYSHFFPEAASPADWSSRTIGYLESKHPRLLILSEIPENASRAQIEEILSINGRAIELKTYLETRYAADRRFGPYVILKPRAELSGMRSDFR